MPYRGPWTLDDQLLQQAREDGRLTEWEVEFYKGNYGKHSVSEKQAPIKRRIEELTLPNPWSVPEDVLRRMVGQGLVTPWEMQFYLSNAPLRRFTAKQAVIKWRIQDNVANSRGQ